MTAPLVWGLLVHTLYLVYRGTTTNESFKWSVYQDDMDDGQAFRRKMSPDREKNTLFERGCPRWPVEPEIALTSSDNGKPPPSLAGEGNWERVWKLEYVQNLYDLGLWDNLADIFVTDYKFGETTPKVGMLGGDAAII